MDENMVDYLGEDKRYSYYHFLNPLQQAGYALSQEKAGKQISVVMQDSYHFSEVVQDEMLIRLLSNAQIRKGKSYSYRELLQMAHVKDKERSFPYPRVFFDIIFNRGYEVECIHCAFSHWYSFDAAKRDLLCIGCTHGLMFPPDLSFAFRLNPLWGEVAKNGGLSVMLTFYRFAKGKPAGRNWGKAGVLAKRNGQQIEIDLIGGQKGNVEAIVECKDAIPSVEKLLEQLAKLNRLAREISVDCYFATLAETIPPEIMTFCEQNNVRVLTRAELVRE
jgi:hypothetical protein